MVSNLQLGANSLLMNLGPILTLPILILQLATVSPVSCEHRQLIVSCKHRQLIVVLPPHTAVIKIMSI